MARKKIIRKPISTRTRFEIFKRDGFICQYCGSHPPKVILHVDHIVPVSGGGINHEDNYITSCDKCNRGKSNKLLSDIPQSLKDKAAIIAEKEAQIKGFYKIIEERSQRIEFEAKQIAQVLDWRNWRWDIGWTKSIKIFLEKLDYYTVLDAMERAKARIPHSDKYAFQYFCGICWKKIKGEDNG